MTERKLREEVHKYVDEGDETILRLVHAMLKEYTLQSEEEDDKLFEELERRSKAYKTGKMKGTTVEEALVRLRKSRKKSA